MFPELQGLLFHKKLNHTLQEIFEMFIVFGLNQ